MSEEQVLGNSKYVPKGVEGKISLGFTLNIF